MIEAEYRREECWDGGEEAEEGGWDSTGEGVGEG
jgi:hypothetical protein